VYFVIQGFSGIVIPVFGITQSCRQFGWDLGVIYSNPIFVAPSAIQIVAGLYLVVGGEWLIKTVFLPAPEDDPEEAQEEPHPRDS
jgi:hypothetical protein